MYALAAADLFGAAEACGVGVGLSFFEVYRGAVLDLLGGIHLLS